MRRFSIRTLMAFVLMSAVGLAALRNASDLWAGMMLLIALAAVGIGVLGAIILRGRERYWWAGFAFFSGGYLALAVGPWLGDTYRPKLGTTQVLRSAYDRMYPAASLPLEDEVLANLLVRREEFAAQLGQMKKIARNANDPAVLVAKRELKKIDAALAANKNAAPRLEQFENVGHSLCSLLAGLLGGTVAVGFHARRERAEAAAGRTET